MRTRPVRDGLVALVAAIVVAGAAPTATADPRPTAPDRVLVGVAGSRAAAGRAIEQAGGRIISYHRGGFFEVDPPSNAAGWASTLDHEAISYAEPEQIGTLDAIPDDPRWADQWALERIGAPEAWERSTGSAEVVVGLVDSGIDASHEDLAGRIWTNDDEIVGNALDDDGNGYVDDVGGIDCRNDDVDPFDDYFHGTHVAGTIGAIGDNATGIAGLNWDVRIMALKWTNHFGQGLVGDAVECLDYAVRNGARIVNASWGFPSYSQTLADAIERAEGAGVLVVASAGNGATDISSGSAHYPASLPTGNVVAATATDGTDALASFSNRGIDVDLAAPGVDVWSTQPNDDYWVASGTSFAASHVTGAAALILAAHPTTTLEGLIDRLLLSTEPVGSLGGLVATGGLLDVAEAIQDDVTPPASPGLSVTPIDPTSASVSWVEPGDDGAGGGAVSAYRVDVSPAGQGAWARIPPPVPSTPGGTAIVAVDGLTPGRGFDVRVVAVDDVGNPASAITSFSTGWAVVVLADDMESGVNGWTPTGTWSQRDEHPHSPATAWTDSPAGPYAVGTRHSLQAPPIDLSTSSAPTLEFWHRFRLQDGRDVGIVEASADGGTTWIELASYTGASDMVPEAIDLSSLAGLPDVRLRFAVASDGAGILDGWSLDDMIVWDPDTDPPAAPQGLTAAAGDGQVTLGWDASPEADLDGYSVERTTDPPSSPTRTWVEVATTGTSGLVDVGLVSGTTYFYRVRATDLAANRSEPSEEAQATPARSSSEHPLTSIVVTSGTSQGDPVSHVDTSDDLRYRVLGNSRKRASTASWEGTVSIDRSNARSLGVEIEMNASALGTATVHVRRNAGKGGWDLAGTLTIGPDDASLLWTTSAVTTYSAADGRVRIRVSLQSNVAATTFGADLATVHVVY